MTTKASQQDVGVSVVPALLTVEQARTYLGATTVWTVRQLVYKGRLPYVKVGKRFNFLKSDLDAYISANRRTAD